MSGIEPITVYHFDQDRFEVRAEAVYPDSVLNEMARRVGENLDKELLSRLGYVKPVRCRDCKYSLLHGTECRHFAAYEPIAGGDEYEEMTYSVSPDGYCAWGVRREDE